MKLYEWLDNKRDFIDTLNIPDELIHDVDVKTALKVKFGQSEMHKIFHKMTGSEVADYLNSVYNSKWKWLVEFSNSQYDIGEVNRKEIKENYLNDVEGELSGNIINQESAYNIDDFINRDKQDNKSENSSKQIGERERTEKYMSYYTTLQQFHNVDRYDLTQLVLQDIKNELCLKIY